MASGSSSTVVTEVEALILATSATFLMFAALFEAVIELPHWRGVAVPDGRSYTAVEHRSDVGVALFADRLPTGNVSAFLTLEIQLRVRDELL